MKLKGVEFHFCPSSKKGRLWRCPDLDTAFLCSIYGIMPPMLETIDTPTRRHKAQLALLGCCLSVFWNGCIAFGFPGVMGSYWQEQFGVGQGQVGLVVTCELFALACSMFFSGKVHLAIGMRRCIALATIVNVAAFAMAMMATNIYMIYGWALISSFGGSFVYGPALTTAQLWMPHKRGLASGLVNLVMGTSAAVITPLWNDMLSSVGYASVNVMVMAGLVITNAVACLLVEVPDRTNLSLQDKEAHRLLTQESKRNSAAGERDFTVREALRSKEFWIIWFCWVLMGAAGVSMVSLSKSYALSLGLGAVVVFTGYNITNGVIRIVVGALSDKLGGVRLAIAAYLLAGLGYVLLIVLRGPVELAFAAALVGVGMGTLFTVSGPVVSNLFGLKYFGLIYGLVLTAYGFVGGVLGPALAGFVLDITAGNYPIVFGYLAAFSVASALLMVILKRVGRGKNLR